MPTLSKPTPIAGPFAYNGDKNTIPDATATAGAASYQQGFPPVTQLPITAGGVPPQRNDFNGILNALSQHIFWQQSGGMYEWSATLDYAQYAEVIGSDGLVYRALQPSGPGVSGVGAKNPTTQPAYWQAQVMPGDIVPPDGVTIKVLNGKLTAVVSPYELGEFYYFRHPTLKPGFQPAQGGLLANAATLYPEAWAYLQTTEGQKLCTTEAAWQAMTTATWATLADGTKVGWDGIGGAPWYVQDLNAGTLRLPDLRGMYTEAAGFDSLGVGGVHGDGIRNIWGMLPSIAGEVIVPPTGVFSVQTLGPGAYLDQVNARFVVLFDASRVVPTAPVNRPRSFGVLACVYLGAPR